MKLNAFQKLAITTVAATIFLIFVGGIVRASGSGLGCPDWPTCFGSWIPPTSADDLPAGFDESEFNVMKTWTEYINRLVGVAIGFLITLTFISSFKYRKTKPVIFYSSAAAFILVLVQGWLGGRVVATELDEWLITIHMVLAIVIVNVLLYAVFKASFHLINIKMDDGLRKKLLWTTLVLFGLTMIQMVLGTQVREAIDLIKNAANVPPRAFWLDSLGFNLLAHRSFSWLILFAGGYLIYILKKGNAEGLILNLGRLNIVFILIQIATGIGIYYLEIPPVLQIAHLGGMSLMVCAQFLYILMLGMAANPPEIKAKADVA